MMIDDVCDGGVDVVMGFFISCGHLFLRRYIPDERILLCGEEIKEGAMIRMCLCMILIFFFISRSVCVCMCVCGGRRYRCAVIRRNRYTYNVIMIQLN